MKMGGGIISSILLSVAIAFSSGAGTAQESGPTIKVTSEDAYAHRIGTREPIRYRWWNRSEVVPYIELEIVVDPNGNVVSAKSTRGPQELVPKALELAHAWKFKPFIQDGKAVSATFTDYVSIYPPEVLPTTHVPFPEIHDWNSLRITLTRTLCYGTCPDYSVEIDGDGTVIYTGNRFVAVTGVQKSRISMDAVRELVDLFRKADYFSLRDSYAATVTDNPTFYTSISFDGKTKKVRNYVGWEVGILQGVTNIEEAIDRIADTYKWIKRPSPSQ
jgi:hypothetical protein